MAYDFLVVGAGLTGCVLAEKLATYGYKILLIDKRLHVGGNCCDHWEDGILVQDYGPHIFHTNDEHVFRYLSRFTRWNNYRHKVVSFRRGKYFPIPINLTTINLFFGCEFRSWAQVDELLKSKRVKIRTIRNSRDVVVSRFGEDLYKAFVRGYTKKQWDFYPEELSPDVLKRLPLRSNNSPYYYNDPWQGMPQRGFSLMMKKMLQSQNIEVWLGFDYCKLNNEAIAPRTIYTGRIDEFFNFKLGELDYRCMKFDFKRLNCKQTQPNSVVNYAERKISYLRTTEFKQFYPEKRFLSHTITCTETASWRGEPAYPVMTSQNIKLARRYFKLAERSRSIFFAGRLGTYRYLNMDQSVRYALDLAAKLMVRS